MTDTEINIAIAEACGWKRYYEKGAPCGADDWEGYNPEGKFCLLEDTPNYCTDFNAAHSAWCSLTREQHREFRNHLTEICVRDGHVCGPCRSVSNATARQRAEAFLRTIGKWKE